MNPRIIAHGLIECLGKRLEHSLSHMMIISGLDHLKMQVHRRTVGNGIEKFPHRLRIQHRRSAPP